MRPVREKRLKPTNSALVLEKATRPESLTIALAVRVMGWTPAPGRFLTGKGGWMSQWRFQPEQNLNDAFRLLDEARADRYRMGFDAGGEFWVRVEIAGGIGEARSTSKPQAITLAVARGLGIDVENG